VLEGLEEPPDPGFFAPLLFDPPLDNTVTWLANSTWLVRVWTAPPALRALTVVASDPGTDAVDGAPEAAAAAMHSIAPAANPPTSTRNTTNGGVHHGVEDVDGVARLDEEGVCVAELREIGRSADAARRRHVALADPRVNTVSPVS
jgi:hypothetical protein